MKKNLNEILTDGVTPTEELITDEMTCTSLEGTDLDRVTSLTLEKTGVKAPKHSFLRKYYKQFSALAACLMLAVGVLAAYRIWGADAPTPDSDDDSDGTSAKDYINMDGIVWGDGNIKDSVPDAENDNADGEPSDPMAPDASVPEGETNDIGCELPVESDDVETDTDCSEDVEISIPGTPVVDVYSAHWNGIEVMWELYCALTKDADATLAVRVDNTLAHVPPEYVYNGKSIAEWNEMILELTDKSNRVTDAYKLGYDLVYGKDIYTGEAPSGVVWDKEYYHEIIGEYGEEFDLLYAEYERFLTDNGLWGEVADDIGLYWEKMEEVAWEMSIEYTQEMDRAYININEARETYILENSVLLGVGSEFCDAAESLGIDVCANGNHAYIFVTAAKLAELAGKINGDGLIFSLATKHQFASEFDENGDPVEETHDYYVSVDEFETELPVPVPEDDTTCNVGIGYDEWETETALPDTTEAWETAIEETGEVSPPHYPY